MPAVLFARTRLRLLALSIVGAVVVAACGGGGGGGGDGGSSSAPTAPAPPVVVAPAANTLAVTVDGGPAALAAAGFEAVNVLYASVTVCTPGSTTACRTIDHVAVDTGSIGLRVVASVLGTGAVPTPSTDPSTGGPLRECVKFADGYSWGSVAVADVTIGGRTLTSLPIQLIGDAAAGSAPSSCVSGPSENDVVDLGSNGILGIGSFLQDCGAACASRAVSGMYYACPSANGTQTCSPTAVALTRQVSHPIASLSSDNNGVVIQLPAVSSPGVATLGGTIYFGVGTQADNALGAARFYTLLTNGTLSVTYNGTTRAGSFIDSGSNANFFSDGSIATCADATFFYCPVTGSGVATSLTETATIVGANGVSGAVTFTVDNADRLFATNATALPGLAGPNGSLQGTTLSGFDFGLPFFYGRTVSVLIEGNTLNGTTGPAIAF